MRLVNMEVDRYGTNERRRLGELSAGLNGICGPRGSGKTTLANWLRHIVAECTPASNAVYPGAWDGRTAAGSSTPFSVASGIVDIRNKDVEFRVATDRNGRLQFDSRDANHRLGHSSNDIHRPFLSSLQREAFEGLAAASGSSDSRSALEQLAHRLGLSQLGHADLSTSRLQERERELEVRLGRNKALQSREALLARQRELEAELSEAKRVSPPVRYVGQDVERRRIDQRYEAIEADLRSTCEQIAALDRAIAAKTNELALRDDTHTQVDVGASYREQLQKLDDRLNRWRQTLRDLKSHRETIEHNATDARLDKQIGEQLSSSKESDPRAAMRSLEAQILNTRQQLDELVNRYTAVPGYDYRSATAAISQNGGYRSTSDRGFRGDYRASDGRVYHDGSGRTYIGHESYLPDASGLPETLRTMQKDLQEVCQQLARYESKTAADTLKQQATQLKRCEEELLQSVEKLIEERAALLRTIANEQHVSVEELTLAFGNWCQCHDHPHLREWLLSTDATKPIGTQEHALDRQGLIEEIEVLKRDHKQASLKADDCRRQLHDADLHRRRGAVQFTPAGRSRAIVDIEYDLDQTMSNLAVVSDLERAQLELDEVRRKLRELSVPVIDTSNFQTCVDRHIAALMPTYYGPHHRESAESALGERRYDLVDGVIYHPSSSHDKLESRYPVPEGVVRIAMRLAVGEALSRQGEPICLIFDESLDDLPLENQQSTVAHLSDVAGHGQQIVVLTADERVADLVRSHRGRTYYLHAKASVTHDIDVNRQLAALANDHEADKWTTPNVRGFHTSHPRDRKAKSEYYLNERSLIEDLPAIEPATAARCRALGVDRIGDLLDVDPYWLAENLRLDEIGHDTVIRYQAKARLLCSIKNLRPFDARVLVGVGIRTPRQLAEMHPSELLERVESFLATEAGRRILQSGNSYELSRITSWIASAEGGASRYHRSSFVDGPVGLRSTQTERSERGDEYERAGRDYHQRDYRRRDSQAGRTNARSRSGSTEGSSSSWSRSSDRSGHVRDERSKRGIRSARRGTNRRRASSTYPVIERDGSRSRTGENRAAAEQTTRSTRVGSGLSGSELRFYLELSSPVVDAPSIGPKSAAKLEQHGIYTVGDLIAANAESLETKLNSRRVSAETIRSWQEQSRLVCRIPNLRGHDAQLLVASDYTSPEELAEMDPETVLAAVLDVARSKQGQRILRGGNEPDLAEVIDWITWSASCRSLNAA